LEKKKIYKIVLTEAANLST